MSSENEACVKLIRMLAHNIMTNIFREKCRVIVTCCNFQVHSITFYTQNKSISLSILQFSELYMAYNGLLTTQQKFSQKT